MLQNSYSKADLQGDRMSEKSDQLSDVQTKVGLPVLGCIPGSAAAVAGIRVGDRIIEVNGMPISDASTYLAARNLEKDLMRVVAYRNGQLLNFTLHFASSSTGQLRDLSLN